MVARISALGGGGSEKRRQLDTGGLRGAPHRGRGGAGCGHGIRLGTDGSVASCGRRNRAVLRLNQGGPVLFGCSGIFLSLRVAQADPVSPAGTQPAEQCGCPGGSHRGGDLAPRAERPGAGEGRRRILARGAGSRSERSTRARPVGYGRSGGGRDVAGEVIEMEPTNLLIYFVLVVFAILGLVTLAKSARIVAQYEKGLIMRLGKYHATVGSGLHFLMPFVDQLIRVDMREKVINVSPQKVITKDNVTVTVDAVVYYKVIDPVRAEFEVQNFGYACTTLAQTNLRNLIGDRALDSWSPATSLTPPSARCSMRPPTPGA